MAGGDQMSKVTSTNPQRILNSSNMWSDPDHGSHGILLSDRIRFYVEEVNLIEPFTDKNLGPASYDLSLGTECWYAEYLKETGEGKRKLVFGERLVLPPNSITFVSTNES